MSDCDHGRPVLPYAVRVANSRQFPRIPSTTKPHRCPCWYGSLMGAQDEKCPCPGGNIEPWMSDAGWNRFGVCNACGHRVFPLWMIPPWWWELITSEIHTSWHFGWLRHIRKWLFNE